MADKDKSDIQQGSGKRRRRGRMPGRGRTLPPTPDQTAANSLGSSFANKPARRRGTKSNGPSDAQSVLTSLSCMPLQSSETRKGCQYAGMVVLESDHGSSDADDNSASFSTGMRQEGASLTPNYFEGLVVSDSNAGSMAGSTGAEEPSTYRGEHDASISPTKQKPQRTKSHVYLACISSGAFVFSSGLMLTLRFVTNLIQDVPDWGFGLAMSLTVLSLTLIGACVGLYADANVEKAMANATDAEVNSGPYHPVNSATVQAEGTNLNDPLHRVFDDSPPVSPHGG